jgi:hypothetical protein
VFQSRNGNHGLEFVGRQVFQIFKVTAVIFDFAGRNRLARRQLLADFYAALIMINRVSRLDGLGAAGFPDAEKFINRGRRSAYEGVGADDLMAVGGQDELKKAVAAPGIQDSGGGHKGQPGQDESYVQEIMPAQGQAELGGEAQDFQGQVRPIFDYFFGKKRQFIPGGIFSRPGLELEARPAGRAGAWP